MGFPHSSVGKESTCNAGDPGLIPGSERSAGEDKGYPLHYSGLENSMDLYSPRGPKELDRTEWLSLGHSIYVQPKGRRQRHPNPVLLPGNSHGWRSLVGCSPWGRTESDMTEGLHFHFSLSRTGEGNGSPLQCSCLENPRDGGAWWAAVYGATQSLTRLKWLSSSSSRGEKFWK